jgi:Rrf2 family protein
MEIPNEFLGKIAQQLAKAGIIESVQGAKGGLRLLRDLEEITLLEVVEAVIGEIFLNDCILNPDSCEKSNTCAVHMVWEKARNQLRNTLKAATFSRLLAENTCLDPFVVKPP